MKHWGVFLMTRLPSESLDRLDKIEYLVPANRSPDFVHPNAKQYCAQKRSLGNCEFFCHAVPPANWLCNISAIPLFGMGPDMAIWQANIHFQICFAALQYPPTWGKK